MTTVYVCNKTTIILHKDVKRMVAAVNHQVITDYRAAWERTAKVVFTTREDLDNTIFLFDDPDLAGALGYHDETPSGNKYGRVFARIDGQVQDFFKKNGISVTLSHEVLELLGNPTVNRWRDMPDGKRQTCEELCFTGDTKVSMLDGTERAIETLAGVSEFWVYGIKDGGIVVARGHSAKMTRRDAPVVAVELDNGEIVRCTPDHKFMLRDGSYVQAGDLTPGTSLMPLYRRHALMERSKLTYEQVLHPGSGAWEFTHRIAAPSCPRGHVRHHKDFNRFNNEPCNLQVMRANDHIELHGQHARALWSAGKHGWQKPNPGKRARDAVRMAEYNRSDAHREGIIGNANMQRLWQRPEFRALHVARGKERMTAQMASEAFKLAREVGHAAFRADPVRRAAAESRAAASAKTERRRKINAAVGQRVQSSRTPEEKSRLGKLAMHHRWHVNGRASEQCAFCHPTPNNHKVVSVKPAGTADVWDLTVDDVHNFALTAGVFVHNCDAVEGDAYPIAVNGNAVDPTYVSNFLWPAWFDDRAPAGTQCDQLDKTPGPFQFSAASPGENYLIIRNIGTGEKQVFGADGQVKELAEHKKHPAARSQRILSA